MTYIKYALVLGVSAALAACGDNNEGTMKPQNSVKCPDHLAFDANNAQDIYNAQGCIADVTGLVYQVHTSKSGKVTTLNFGADYKTDFSAVIFSSAKDKFKDGLSGYTEKKVKVHGVIRSYSTDDRKTKTTYTAPQIIVDDPQQLTIVAEDTQIASSMPSTASASSVEQTQNP